MKNKLILLTPIAELNDWCILNAMRIAVHKGDLKGMYPLDY